MKEELNQHTPISINVGDIVYLDIKPDIHILVTNVYKGKMQGIYCDSVDKEFKISPSVPISVVKKVSSKNEI